MKKNCVNAQTSSFARIVAALLLPTADERIAGKFDLPLLLVHDQNNRQVPVLESARTAHVCAVVDCAAQETMGSACTV